MQSPVSFPANVYPADTACTAAQDQGLSCTTIVSVPSTHPAVSHGDCSTQPCPGYITHLHWS